MSAFLSLLVFAVLLALAAGGLACTQLTLHGHKALSPIYSAYDVVTRARPALAPNSPFYAVNQYDHTLPFYLGRTVTMVAIPDVAAFAAAWRRERAACAAFAPDAFEGIRAAHGLDAKVIAAAPRYLIACKP